MTAAPAANGATVRISGDCNRYGDCDYVMHVDAAPGEENHLSLTSSSVAAVISDQTWH